ncbi:hypothetical protein PISMIDRAFT_16519 [Pisolithus microcarpus 441]|uniref:Uncharacterized protein n=1 Tax=Pisolithus microcarpus 441 TaxID=765257 RepID=A0A0C9Z649_9AGAM|nr:hypothetical protein PISMIDRAFT_16519 [Pisolithus microcarpus 441]
MATSSTISSLVPYARENNYEYLPGIPTSFCPEASWFIPPLSMTSHPRDSAFSLLEKSYVVVLVSPVEAAYRSFVPVPCNVYLSISSFDLPKLQQVQYQLLSSSLSDCIHDDFETLLPTLIGEDGPSSSSNPPEH